jgi:hypothetical protein
MNNVFSAKSETFAERCATKKTLRSWGDFMKKQLIIFIQVRQIM